VRIGLTHTRNHQKYQYYVDWLTGDDVEVVKLSVADDNLDEINCCDALVLSGGVDVHPKFYGGRSGYPGEPEEFNEKRDEFEITAFRSAEKNNIPILGICRGMQLINVIHNGTLIQSLSASGLHHVHKGEPDKMHPVNIEAGTLLHDIIRSDQIKINSAHHQAIDKLGEGLMVSARSDEGVIEGIERTDKSGKSFLLAVQWHPERMFRFQLENSPASSSIRERFFQEIKKSITDNK
jgi:putative glutamine amidotransferase